MNLILHQQSLQYGVETILQCFSMEGVNIDFFWEEKRCFNTWRVVFTGWFHWEKCLFLDCAPATSVFRTILFFNSSTTPCVNLCFFHVVYCLWMLFDTSDKFKIVVWKPNRNSSYRVEFNVGFVKKFVLIWFCIVSNRKPNEISKQASTQTSNTTPRLL